MALRLPAAIESWPVLALRPISAAAIQELSTPALELLAEDWPCLAGKEINRRRLEGV